MLRAINYWYGLILLAAAAILATAAHNAWGGGVVSIFESRFGVPGTTHVVPECGCTFKYLGTTVRGVDYEVHFRKMD